MPTVVISTDQDNRIKSLGRELLEVIDFSTAKLEYGDEEVNRVIAKAIANSLAREQGAQHVDIEIDFENYAINAYGDVWLEYDSSNGLDPFSFADVELSKVRIIGNSVDATPIPYCINTSYIELLIAGLMK